MYCFRYFLHIKKYASLVYILHCTITIFAFVLVWAKNYTWCGSGASVKPLCLNKCLVTGLSGFHPCLHVGVSETCGGRFGYTTNACGSSSFYWICPESGISKVRFDVLSLCPFFAGKLSNCQLIHFPGFRLSDNTEETPCALFFSF